MPSDGEGPDLSCFDFANSGDEQESREDVLKKHLQEEEQLRVEAKAKKKAIDKSDKPARRACEAEFAEALEQLAARHAKELGGVEDAMAALTGPDLSCFDFGEEEEAAAPAPLPVAKPKDKGKGKAAQRAAKKAEEEAQRELRIAQAKAEPSSVRCRQPGEPAALGDFVDWALEQQELAGCPGPEDLLAANIATGCSLDPISFLRRDTSASRSLTPPHTASRTRHRSLAAASSRMRMRSRVHRRPQAGARRPLRPHQGGDRVQQHAAAAGEPDV